MREEMDAKYNGTWRVAGNVLEREDGCRLQLCTRTRTTPTKSSTFIVDKTKPPGTYVSSVYGSEFEFRGIRYGITWTEDGRAIIDALRQSETRT